MIGKRESRLKKMILIPIPNEANAGKKISEMIFPILIPPLILVSFSWRPNAIAKIMTGENVIMSQSITTLTTMMTASARSGIMRANPKTVFMSSAKAIDETDHILLVTPRDAVFRTEPKRANNGQVFPVAFVSN